MLFTPNREALRLVLQLEKMDREPLLRVIHELHDRSSAWDREARAHVTPHLNRLRDGFLFCLNDANCSACRATYERIPRGFAKELAQLADAARRARPGYLSRAKSLAEQIAAIPARIKKTEETATAALQRISQEAHKTVLALRTAPPLTGESWDYQLGRMRAFSLERTITPEDRGIPQECRVRDWLREQLAHLEREQKNLRAERDHLARGILFAISSDERLHSFLGENLGGATYDVEAEFRRYASRFAPAGA